jgi:putative phosphoribosyl transferase
MVRFRDRADAGLRLARLVEPLLAGSDAVVLGIPRGGVIVGRALADALGLPLDVLVVRKLGVPGHEEYGFGAIAEEGVVVLDQATLAMAGLSDADVADVEATERRELERRVAAYESGRESLPVTGRTVVIVDDGVAMGGTMRAAIAMCRSRAARRVIVAVGVAPVATISSLAYEADDAVAAMLPEPMSSVGEWYEDFAQASDREVLAALGGGNWGPCSTKDAVRTARAVRLLRRRRAGRPGVPRCRGLRTRTGGQGSSRRSPAPHRYQAD